MQTVWDPKNSILEFLARFFVRCAIITKHIVHNLRRFKENYRWHFLIEKTVNTWKLTKNDKINLLHQRFAEIKQMIVPQ